jgi:hypothetical protein
MSAYINTSFKEMSSQFESSFCTYLFKALYCKSFKLLLKDELQVVVYKVFCLVKVHHCLYKLYQLVLCSFVYVDPVSVFTSHLGPFSLCSCYGCVYVGSCSSKVRRYKGSCSSEVRRYEVEVRGEDVVRGACLYS